MPRKEVFKSDICCYCKEKNIWWKHYGCNGTMYIYDNGELECEKCGQRFPRKNARLCCRDHSISYKPFWLNKIINFWDILVCFNNHDMINGDPNLNYLIIIKKKNKK